MDLPPHEPDNLLVILHRHQNPSTRIIQHHSRRLLENISWVVHKEGCVKGVVFRKSFVVDLEDGGGVGWSAGVESDGHCSNETLLVRNMGRVVCIVSLELLFYISSSVRKLVDP